MRVLLLSLLLLAPACDRWETSWNDIGTTTLHGEWERLGLPVDGDDTVKRADPDLLIVIHPENTSSGHSRTANRWRAALTAQGWSTDERYSDLISSTVDRTSFKTPDGRLMLLEMREQRRELHVMVRAL